MIAATKAALLLQHLNLLRLALSHLFSFSFKSNTYDISWSNVIKLSSKHKFLFYFIVTSYWCWRKAAFQRKISKMKLMLVEKTLICGKQETQSWPTAPESIRISLIPDNSEPLTQPFQAFIVDFALNSSLWEACSLLLMVYFLWDPLSFYLSSVKPSGAGFFLQMKESQDKTQIQKCFLTNICHLDNIYIYIYRGALIPDLSEALLCYQIHR